MGKLNPNLEPIIDQVKAETIRQDKKWGADRNHHPVVWNAILTEETGEVAKEAVEFTFLEGALEQPEDSRPNVQDLRKDRLKKMQKELIQVAAVAIQAALSIEIDLNK